MKNKIDKICQDLYDGVNYPGTWHGCDFWGKASDFHEHSFFIWDTIQKVLFKNGERPLNIVETGRCTGQSTVLFSAIAYFSGGYFSSFDISDWNREFILQLNEKYEIKSNYHYVVDSSLKGDIYLNQDYKIDVLFLDSLHTYDLVKNETLLFEKYLSDTSIIFFHDTVWCFDSVMGWIKDYLENKRVIWAKHQDTNKQQCEYCMRLSVPGLDHGRPIMINGRPNFQSPYDKLEESPYYNNLNDSFINWSNKTFEDCINNNEKMFFTNIEAGCGIGALVINKK